MYSPIAIVKSEEYAYPKIKELFRPDECYPEYLFDDLSKHNSVYKMIRDGFFLLGLDANNFGKKNWNPLGKYIEPNTCVLLKPNLVMDVNPSGDGLDCLITNASVVAAVIDYVIIALKGEGKIVIGDAPMQECNFDNLISKSGYDKLLAYYKGKLDPTKISIELIDFRDLTSKVKNCIYYSELTERTTGKLVELNDDSEFSELTDDVLRNIRITNYDPDILRNHHKGKKHEYYINENILRADTIINLPKPKTHRKAGITISLKNMIGINSRKEYLPHHTSGAIECGGDEYENKSLLKKAKSMLLDSRNSFMQKKKKYFFAYFINRLLIPLNLIIKKTQKDNYFEGSWYGNDTISKTIVDLNKIIFYADKQGIIQDSVQRKYFIIADMIVSGEKEGPVMPNAKEVGIIAMGENPVCFDEMIGRIMGAKLNLINTLKHARKPLGRFCLVEKDTVPYAISNDPRWNGVTIDELNSDSILYFSPTSGWIPAFNIKES